MQGASPVELVTDGLRDITIPSLTRPPIGPNEAPTKELVDWGIKFYVYSAVLHLRTILTALVNIAKTENIPATFVVARNIFEWTASAAYIRREVLYHLQRVDIPAAWDVMTVAATGNLWARKHGHKYGDPSSTVLLNSPDPVRVGIAVTAYEEYQSKELGTKEAHNNYGLLSELSHPNSACLQQYHFWTGDGREVMFAPPTEGSPLPIVNWCLIDQLTFLEELLEASGETTVRAALIAVLRQIVQLAQGKRRG